jgi:hypothetical protein
VQRGRREAVSCGGGRHGGEWRHGELTGEDEREAQRCGVLTVLIPRANPTAVTHGARWLMGSDRRAQHEEDTIDMWAP